MPLSVNSLRHVVVDYGQAGAFTDRGMYDDPSISISRRLPSCRITGSVSSISAPSITKKGCTKRQQVMLDRALYINAQDAESWYYAGLTQQKLTI